jgi:hypothetical protein
MGFNINGTVITGGTSITATDTSSNKIYQQLSTGQVLKPVNSSNNVLIPMFNVGFNAGGWTVISGIVPFAYTAGNGYYNVGSCYSTSTYAFTAPFTGLYLFKVHVYTYGNNVTPNWYYHPLFYVNGSSSSRRPGGTPYRIREYGFPANYGHDSDCCELIYLTAGDYVQSVVLVVGTIEGYGVFSTFSGSYISN